jgi:hypothetical protein
MKAIFGGSVKKPLMTKVSMRHLNEIVRERNQYSRDAMEAWQDFINLKGRMDTELSKVTKRNNFLVEELESWKQQFLKFQAFAEQLTKETQELKVKIEGHKRENRRLTSLIDQQKDDTARLTVRLSGTEKQRDDALEALVLQQEIAEELERERKRNAKEISALQHTNSALLRQRDEAQRVVLHLRALIDGQAHHMQHIVKSLNAPNELNEYIEEGFEDVPEETEEELDEHADPKDTAEVGTIRGVSGVDPKSPSRAFSRASTVDGKHLDGEDVSPDMERRLLSSPVSRKRYSNVSMIDVADKHLRDKTDAIAYIIRNISEQCAAAVEGLHLAQRADSEEEAQSDKRARLSTNSENGDPQSSAGSDCGDGDSSYLQPERNSSIPPTPDLVHNRSSTSMSMASASTTPDRHSLQQYKHEEVPDIPTKIVEDEAYENSDQDLSQNDIVPSKLPHGMQRVAEGRITLRST